MVMVMWFAWVTWGRFSQENTPEGHTETHKSKVVMLGLFDLSAVFDTIDHEILLKRILRWCGINGTELKWFQSYLKERTQTVSVGSSHSKYETLKYGVQHGSVLGSMLFSV